MARHASLRPLIAPSMLLAAVDVGSNSFRLEIGRADGSHIERRGYWKEIVRLAAGLDESGNPVQGLQVRLTPD